MRSHRILWILTILALLLTTSAPQALAAWQCEGHDCGNNPWVCCCESPAQADECSNPPPRFQHSDKHAGISHGDCACVLAAISTHDSRAGAAQTLLSLVLVSALLPQAPRIELPHPARLLVRAVPERGPPLPRVAVATPALRGPPFLDIPVRSS